MVNGCLRSCPSIKSMIGGTVNESPVSAKPRSFQIVKRVGNTGSIAMWDYWYLACFFYGVLLSYIFAAHFQAGKILQKKKIIRIEGSKINTDAFSTRLAVVFSLAANYLSIALLVKTWKQYVLFNRFTQLRHQIIAMNDDYAFCIQGELWTNFA